MQQLVQTVPAESHSFQHLFDEGFPDFRTHVRISEPETVVKGLQDREFGNQGVVLGDIADDVFDQAEAFVDVEIAHGHASLPGSEMTAQQDSA